MSFFSGNEEQSSRTHQHTQVLHLSRTTLHDVLLKAARCVPQRKFVKRQTMSLFCGLGLPMRPAYSSRCILTTSGRREGVPARGGLLQYTLKARESNGAGEAQSTTVSYILSRRPLRGMTISYLPDLQPGKVVSLLQLLPLADLFGRRSPHVVRDRNLFDSLLIRPMKPCSGFHSAMGSTSTAHVKVRSILYKFRGSS